MRINLAIGMASLAAALAVPAAFSQATAPPAPPAPPRARIATAFFAQKETPWLGIGVVDITGDRAKALKLKDEHGAEVTQVEEDSPAAKAGIKEGDVVLEYNGQRVEGQEQLGRMVRETPVGRQAKIGVWRNGAAQTLTATLASHKGMVMDSGDWGGYTVKIPPMPPMPTIEIPQIQAIWQSVTLGIVGEPLERQAQLAEFFGVKEGVLVKSVTRNSAAEKAGIKAGDVIVKVDDTNVSSTHDISSALRQLRSKRTFTVTVVRNRKEMPLTVTLESAGMREHAAAAESHC